MTKHAEELAKLGWQYFECPACGSEGARAFPKPEPEQEPCVHAKTPKGCYRVRCQLGNKCVDDDMSFRAAPPQRTWVGLTDEDVSEIVRGTHNTGSFVRAITAKLKEKNT